MSLISNLLDSISLIANLYILPIHPEIALGILRIMDRYQGGKHDGWRDELPGKIMHEFRNGELSRVFIFVNTGNDFQRRRGFW